jgi:vesicle-associated membrane protein 7
LEDIHGRFVKTYGRAALTALAYAMNDEFSRVLSQQMDYYSNDPNADRINRMRGEINQVMHPFIFSFFLSTKDQFIEENIF